MIAPMDGDSPHDDELICCLIEIELLDECNYHIRYSCVCQHAFDD